MARGVARRSRAAAHPNNGSPFLFDRVKKLASAFLVPDRLAEISEVSAARHAQPSEILQQCRGEDDRYEREIVQHSEQDAAGEPGRAVDGIHDAEGGRAPLLLSNRCHFARKHMSDAPLARTSAPR